MRFGVVGRTSMLVNAARALVSAGHEIAFVHTCRAEAHHGADQEAFRALAQEAGAPCLETTDTRATLPTWLDAAADVAISVNWPTVIRDEALGAFPFGILNAHAGDLPRYRGNACPNWAILNFERRIALTIHRMSAELDAGPWLCKRFLDIDDATYVREIYDWLDVVVPQAFVSAMALIPTQGFIDQDPKVRPLRTYPRRPSDGRINWAAPSRAILALVRASSHPFDGAYTTIEGDEIVRVFRARPHEPDGDFCAVPGQVCARHGENPVIATGDAMVELEECGSAGRDSAATKRLILSSLRNRLI